MNLKKEIDKKMWHGSNIIRDDRYFLLIEDAIEVAESYAKEKVKEAYKAGVEQEREQWSMRWVMTDELIYDKSIEWWEENK